MFIIAAPAYRLLCSIKKNCWLYLGSKKRLIFYRPCRMSKCITEFQELKRFRCTIWPKKELLNCSDTFKNQHIPPLAKTSTIKALNPSKEILHESEINWLWSFLIVLFLIHSSAYFRKKFQDILSFIKNVFHVKYTSVFFFVSIFAVELCVGCANFLKCNLFFQNIQKYIYKYIFNSWD